MKKARFNSKKIISLQCSLDNGYLSDGKLASGEMRGIMIEKL